MKKKTSIEAALCRLYLQECSTHFSPCYPHRFVGATKKNIEITRKGLSPKMRNFKIKISGAKNVLQRSNVPTNEKFLTHII